MTIPYYALKSLKTAVLQTARLGVIRPSDCTLLILLIEQKTGLRLSELTLSRLYGFSLSRFEPSAFTLEALAQYCGYQSWNAWRDRNPEPGRASEAGLLQSRDFNKLFYMGIQPMWIFDERTLDFLVVNDAALWRYGYTREQFHSMTILDIRPNEDHILVYDALEAAAENSYFPRPARHLKADGSPLDVEILSYEFDMKGYQARLVTPLLLG